MLRLSRLSGPRSPDGRLDAERRAALFAPGGIDAQATNRDAALRAMVHALAVAVITAQLAVVVDVQLAAAMTTSHKPGQEQLSLPNCASDLGTTHAGRVVGDHAKIPLELGPGDVRLMMILDQHIPFSHRP